VAKSLQKQPWDVIHVQHCTQYIPEIRRLNPNAKIVLHIHAEWFSQSNFEVIAKRLRSVDLLWTVSDYVTRKTKQNFPGVADRCETMYNGIDLHEFDHEKNFAAARARKQKRILYVGGIWPHKGPHIRIDALKLVAEKFPDVQLDLVGPQGAYPLEEACDVKDHATLERMAPFFKKSSPNYLDSLKSGLGSTLADKVTFHGFVSRQALVDFYYDADVFVFPPLWNEAFGCTPVEAMAAGVPAVVTRCGGIVETVEDRHTGFLVEPNNAQALADVMLRLLEDDALREKMGRAGRQRALQLFTWDAIVAAMHARYEILAETPSTVAVG
jgi:glycosyltransferase involved in cell wall biosynthesis